MKLRAPRRQKGARSGWGCERRSMRTGQRNDWLIWSARLRGLGYRPKPVRRVLYTQGEWQSRRALGSAQLRGSDRARSAVKLDLASDLGAGVSGLLVWFSPGAQRASSVERLAEIITVGSARSGWWRRTSKVSLTCQHDSSDAFSRAPDSGPRFLRIIGRFLKAGVMEDGVFAPAKPGLRKGDWFRPSFQTFTCIMCWMSGLRSDSRTCRGKAYLVRYADDFVACFHLEEDAQRFMVELTTGWRSSTWRWSRPRHAYCVLAIRPRAMQTEGCVGPRPLTSWASRTSSGAAAADVS